MNNPTILLFIPLTFTICYATSQIRHDVQYFVGCTPMDFTHTYMHLQVAIDGDEAFYVDFPKKDIIITAPPFLDTAIRGIFDIHHTLVNANKSAKSCPLLLEFMEVIEKNPPEKQEAPDSVLYTSEEVELGVENRLICYARHFYPPPIQVSWTRNGEVVKDGASLSRYFPDEDGSGTFHQIASLDFIPHEGDEYSCSVTHPALDKPTVVFWDSELEQVAGSSSGWDAFCGVFLTLGILAAAGGTFLIVKSGRVCPLEVL